jgi:flavin-dependent dehydrogenase
VAVSDYDGAEPEFSASPRIPAPLCGPGWLACGSAAMGFDPICGDGTAHAVREAILALAVIRGGDHGMPAHYEARLTAAGTAISLPFTWI